VIPFNKPFVRGDEGEFFSQVVERRQFSGDGDFSEQCSAWLRRTIAVEAAFLVTSGTAALEMAAMLLDVRPGDEVIMPSYTFPSTANAVVLRRATPVFVDIRPDTLNLDERLVEEQINERTRAICVVHYAGVPAEMDVIMELASQHGLSVVEDAAQALMSTYNGRPVGGIGDFGAFSFHATKNLTCGEGGALLVREPEHVLRAEIIREKGTNRTQFARGAAAKYEWIDAGSSYLLNELSCAHLKSQLDVAVEVTNARIALRNKYWTWFEEYEERGWVRRPIVPSNVEHNGHSFFVILPSNALRNRFIASMEEKQIRAVFHYLPLHTAPAGQYYGLARTRLPVTEDLSGRIVRLPLWVGLEDVWSELSDAMRTSLHGIFT